MQRKEGKYNVEDILSKAIDPYKNKKQDAKVDFDGDLINMASQRYWLFKHKGVKCINCGIVGEYFVKERFHKNKPYHFNLYVLNGGGSEVLMTKDHIKPKAKGGKDQLSNYQPMCSKCNNLKDNAIPKSKIRVPSPEKLKERYKQFSFEELAKRYYLATRSKDAKIERQAIQINQLTNHSGRLKKIIKKERYVMFELITSWPQAFAMAATAFAIAWVLVTLIRAM